MYIMYSMYMYIYVIYNICQYKYVKLFYKIYIYKIGWIFPPPSAYRYIHSKKNDYILYAYKD